MAAHRRVFVYTAVGSVSWKGGCWFVFAVGAADAGDWLGEAGMRGERRLGKQTDTRVS